jgi:hypothetical protein
MIFMGIGFAYAFLHQFIMRHINALTGKGSVK